VNIAMFNSTTTKTDDRTEDYPFHPDHSMKASSKRLGYCDGGVGLLRNSRDPKRGPANKKDSQTRKPKKRTPTPCPMCERKVDTQSPPSMNFQAPAIRFRDSQNKSRTPSLIPPVTQHFFKSVTLTKPQHQTSRQQASSSSSLVSSHHYQEL
jgi:hypothetical protein